MTLWTPAQIETALWLDASDQNTIILDGNNKVEQWLDKSGSGRHANQNNSVERPSFSSVNNIDFSGTTFLYGNFSITLSSMSVFAVARYSGSTSWQRIFTLSDSANDFDLVNGYIPIVRDSNNDYLCAHQKSTGSHGLVALAPDTYGIFSGIHSGVAVTNRINGGIGSTNNFIISAAITRFLVGKATNSTGYLTGSISEIIIIESAVDSGDRQTIEGYLAHKWGLDGSLPTDHQYKKHYPGWSSPKGGIRLEWKVNTIGNTGQYIYRSREPMSENLPIPIANIDPGLNWYNDMTTVSGELYYYRIGAHHQGIVEVSDEIRQLAGQIWTPAEIQTALWLDASAATTVILDANGNVYLWADKSGNGCHVIQSTPSERPSVASKSLNGYDTIQFNGVDTNLNLQASALDIMRNTAHGWAISVYRTDSTDSVVVERPVICFSTGTGPQMRLGLLNSGTGHKNQPQIGGRRLDTDSYNGSGVHSVMAEQWLLQSGYMEWGSNKASLWINGGFSTEGTSLWSGAGNTSNTDSLRARVGGNVTVDSPSTVLHGKIAEIIVGNTELTVNTRQQIEGYLAYKWHLTSNLPVDHPYKNTPPVKT